MAAIHLQTLPDREEQLHLMQEDARYDVADDGDKDHTCIPDPSVFTDIASRPAPPKIPKVFVSNDCTFNCAYCGCRCSNERRHRYSHEPREMAEMAVSEAVKNGHGIFVTSAICRNADYTEERIVATLQYMREELHYPGFIHAKVMPGTDPALIEQAGRYANRLSVNIEVARASGYERIAKQKNRDNILTPMRQISALIRRKKAEAGRSRSPFATSQTTQLMPGSTQEDDHTILTLSEALYRTYRLSRVYYSPFQYRHPAKGYDLDPVSTPSWRTRRLYQADRLLQLYGFTPEEIVPASAPLLEEELDPKLSWAMRNIHLFPVEVNSADYDTLLRIPGIGIVYAKKILRARRYCTITHDVLRKIGVSLKRSVYFITCNGKYEGGAATDRPDSLRRLLATPSTPVYEQLSF